VPLAPLEASTGFVLPLSPVPGTASDELDPVHSAAQGRPEGPRASDPRLPGDTHVSELDQALLAQGAEALVGRARLQEELRQAHALAPEQGAHGGPARAPRGPIDGGGFGPRGPHGQPEQPGP
jgi:hypothetical protein